MAEDLIALGLKDPVNSAARESLWEFVLSPQISPEVRQRNIRLVLEAEVYIGRRVRRIAEPERLGIVKFIRRAIPGSSARSLFVACVCWDGKSRSPHIVPLDLIELLP